jgi:hypothetical protein
MARDVDFRALGDRESPWTTGVKIEFPRVHCEIQNSGFLEHILKSKTIKGL